MCIPNSEMTDREKEKQLSCMRCGPQSVIVHRIAGRTMIQCAYCQRSVFEIDFQAARDAWEKGAAA